MNLIYKYLKENFLRNSLLAALLVFAQGCYQNANDPTRIASINIIDRNGMAETISEKERLENFQKTNFLSTQPYQKVLRVYGRNENGDVHSYITSYHPNGQIKQYLEAVNNRALGKYLEWHSNGMKKIESSVIGGIADINTQAEQSWLFDGINRAYNDEGVLTAEISYQKGELEGESKYYHPNGKLWKICPYVKNVPHGTQQVFLSDGTLFMTMENKEGVKDGVTLRFWSPSVIAYEEHYEKGLLIHAKYFDRDGNLESEIADGNGFRTLFGKERLQELQEFKGGKQEGKVKFFDEKGRLVSSYSLKNGEKEGEEVNYYPSGDPKLSMTWTSGVLNGTVKTWYENGAFESQREISKNLKNGLFTSWYRNGNLMFVEEYDNDRLVKGEYYRPGEKLPLSKIEGGKGIASLFDGDGIFSRKIIYQEGKPVE